MRDWSRLLHSIAKLSYEQIVARGREKSARVLDIIEKYSDSDSAPLTLVGLAAYTATVDDELSEKELKLVKDILGVNEKEFLSYVQQIEKDDKIVRDLVDIANSLTREEMNEAGDLMSLIFAVDGVISDKELAFMKKLYD